MSSLASRRGFMRGFATLAAVGSAGVAVPAAAKDAASHPDQALFDAEAALRRTEASREAACAADRAAQRAFRDALGPCPEILHLSAWEKHEFDTPYPRRRGIGWLGFEYVRVPLEPDDDPGVWHNPHPAWMGKGLRRIIEVAPAVYGRAGRTPHLIRRWRDLLPVAEARDARRFALQERFQTVRLWREREAADKALSAALTDLSGLTATTAAGLAVKVRQLDAVGWREKHPVWRTLLESAAAVSGVTLRERGEYERCV